MKTSFIIKSLFLGLTLTSIAACSGDVEKEDYDKVNPTPSNMPTVTTGNVAISGIAAEISLTLNVPEGVNISRAGVVVSDKENIPLADPNTKYSNIYKIRSGEQSVAVTNLEIGKTYYAKAYAYVEGGHIVYGDTKEFTATDGYDFRKDIDVDFAEEADVAPFSVASLGESRQKFELVPLALLAESENDPITYGFANTVYNHQKLFYYFSGALGSYCDEGLLSYKLNMNNRNFADVTIGAYSIAALFGEDYADYPGDFEVYASAEPITTEEQLAAADKIATCNFSTNPEDKDGANFYKEFTCTIPMEYKDVCYITIHNKSDLVLDATGSPIGYHNLGVIISKFVVNSLYAKSQQQ